MDKWLAALTTVVVAIVYLTGYAYLDGFYEYYNISLQELGMSPQSILVHAALPFRKLVSELPLAIIILMFTIGVIIMAALGGGRYLIKWLKIRLEPSNRNSMWAAILVVFLAISLHVFLGAQKFGFETAKIEFSKLYRMAILGEPEGFDITGFRTRNPNTTLYHLVTSRTTYYGVIKFNGEKRRWIIRIPKSDALAMRVYQDAVE